MTLRGLMFDPDRARSRSRLKWLAAVVGIIAGSVAAISGLLKLPRETAAAVVSGLQPQLDARYATKTEAKELADGHAKTLKIQIEESFKEIDSRFDERDRRLDRIDERLDKILFHAASTHGILDAASVAPPAPPLPRRRPQ